ncbi:MAG: SRPBCC family protein [Flavobacteriales bacterium]
MKYTIETTINRPKKEVVALYDNIPNLYKWMEGLESVKLISGEEGKKGAKTEMVFKTPKRVMTMTETILQNDLPDKMVTSYQADGVYNIIFTEFHENGEQTLYRTIQEFKFKGFMRIIGFFFPKAFKKQSLKYMEDFKTFVENQED